MIMRCLSLTIIFYILYSGTTQYLLIPWFSNWKSWHDWSPLIIIYWLKRLGKKRKNRLVNIYLVQNVTILNRTYLYNHFKFSIDVAKIWKFRNPILYRLSQSTCKSWQDYYHCTKGRSNTLQPGYFNHFVTTSQRRSDIINFVG